MSGRIILPIDKKEISGNEFSDKNKINPNYEYDDIDDEDDDEDFDDSPITTRIIGDMDDFSDGIGGKPISIGIGIKLPKNPIGYQESRLKMKIYIL